MKKLLTLTLLIAWLSASAQTTPRTQTIPKMPEQFLIPLTKAQVIRIDSAIQATANMIDSKTMTVNFGNAFSPFYEQVRRQIDTTKVKKP